VSTVWRAADVARSEREDSFMHFVGESIVPYGNPADLVLEDHNEVQAADVGMLRIMRMRWSGGRAARTSTHVRRSDPEFCKIDVVSSGRLGVEQSDRRPKLCAGTFSFVDLSRPSRVAASQANLTVVMFPRALLPLRDRDISQLTGTTFDGTQPGGALVTSVVEEMVGSLHVYEKPAGARIAASVLDLILATLATRLDRTHLVPADSRRRLLVLRVRTFIEDNLGDPELAPPVIAARHHVSLRHLHKLFEDEGTTIAGLIRARRLAKCRDDLLDPAQAGKPVSAVAARWGLRDPAYFSRAFAAVYGVPPAEYRRWACADLRAVHEDAGHGSITSAPDTFGLTPREEEVLRLIGGGYTNAQIAKALFISESTVSVHVSRVLAKLQVPNRVAAATVAHRTGRAGPGRLAERKP
jgi:DNA-binding CsgD family transcriptional regulator/AraC-like DNA-binding protein